MLLTTRSGDENQWGLLPLHPISLLSRCSQSRLLVAPAPPHLPHNLTRPESLFEDP